MNTRNGKIARLPRHVRNQLNTRLEDGEPGTKIVEWLNGVPDVQQVLKWHFGGRPISEQNLSEWKQGGYGDWLKHQQTRDLVLRLTDETDELEADADDMAISDRLSTLLAAKLAGVAEALLEDASEPRERWQRLREMLQELGQLRREDHQAARLQMDQERWDRETERLNELESEKKIQQAKSHACAPFWAALRVGPLAQAFGGGEKGRRIAAMITELQSDLEPGTLGGPTRTDLAPSKPVQPGPTGSNLIKPDQTVPAGTEGEGKA